MALPLAKGTIRYHLEKGKYGDGEECHGVGRLEDLVEAREGCQAVDFKVVGVRGAVGRSGGGRYGGPGLDAGPEELINLRYQLRDLGRVLVRLLRSPEVLTKGRQAFDERAVTCLIRLEGGQSGGTLLDFCLPPP